jgi:hypothetical protein
VSKRHTRGPAAYLGRLAFTHGGRDFLVDCCRLEIVVLVLVDNC